MTKNHRIIIAMLVVMLLSGFGYLLLSSGTDEAENTAVSNQQSSTSPQKESPQTQEANQYVNYSADTVANTKGQRILFFHAPWCPQCRQLDASIRAGTIPPEVTIFKVDYDTNQKLRQQYGVTIQTTLVLLDDTGSEAKKYVAYDQPSLDAIVKNLL
jgi:thiol-disulfide isomerase/thioredoxin